MIKELPPLTPEQVQCEILGLEGSIASIVLEKLDEDSIAQLNGQVSPEEIERFKAMMPAETRESWNVYVHEAARLLWLRRDHGMFTDALESDRNFADAQRVFYDIYHDGDGSGSQP